MELNADRPGLEPLDFKLAGEKLRGRWHLVRMKANGGSRRASWLLIKGRDEQAREWVDLVKTAPKPNEETRQIA